MESKNKQNKTNKKKTSNKKKADRTGEQIVGFQRQEVWGGGKNGWGGAQNIF